MSTANKFRVLVAEDNLLINDMIRHMLTTMGHTVVGSATTGVEAVEMSARLQPDIILMDIEMPEMNGLDATRLIQMKNPCPVVLITAHDDPELVSRASRAGAGAYLLKPPEAPELSRTMAIAAARFADLMELRELNAQLQSALTEIKTLRGMLPICAYCKKIRDDKGYWTQLEKYVHEHTEATFTHGICQECTQKLLSQLDAESAGSATTCGDCTR